ncbi:hypothetical protein [Pedobacter sp. SYSU D00535]|uniref:hypothetical protein n=1 Tax=Pedobacter sp. SYSU D00535 TaxID=2810308 RepID=UPI001A95D37D|nr:hypothetical protein [Pedobacter sp. SYSU D00535]
MSKVSIQNEKTVLWISSRFIKNYREVVLIITSNGVNYTIAVNQQHIKDFIQDNLEKYRGWLDANYCSWEQDNNNELASEMAARVWKSDWMLTDYVNALTDAELAELETAPVAERRAA